MSSKRKIVARKDNKKARQAQRAKKRARLDTAKSNAMIGNTSAERGADAVIRSRRQSC